MNIETSVWLLKRAIHLHFNALVGPSNAPFPFLGGCKRLAESLI